MICVLEWIPWLTVYQTHQSNGKCQYTMLYLPSQYSHKYCYDWPLWQNTFTLVPNKKNWMNKRGSCVYIMDSSSCINSNPTNSIPCVWLTDWLYDELTAATLLLYSARLFFLSVHLKCYHIVMLSHVSHPIEDSQSPSNLIQLKELKKKRSKDFTPSLLVGEWRRTCDCYVLQLTPVCYIYTRGAV